MMRKGQTRLIQLCEVPKSYSSNIKSRSADNKIEFYDNLLQVTIGTNGMIFDLDSSPIKEVESIENIDALMQPDTFVNTGFVMAICYNHRDTVGTNCFRRRQLHTNEF